MSFFAEKERTKKKINVETKAIENEINILLSFNVCRISFVLRLSKEKELAFGNFVLWLFADSATFFNMESLLFCVY
ncbi:hypothetical protein bcgnr5369_11170 [Bacillus cereus]